MRYNNDTNNATLTDSPFRAAQRNSIPGWLARGAPVLPARQTANGRWRVWCYWCQAEHHHGGPELPAHRIAPCTRPGSPYRANGYVLVAEVAGEVAA